MLLRPALFVVVASALPLACAEPSARDPRAAGEGEGEGDVGEGEGDVGEGEGEGDLGEGEGDVGEGEGEGEGDVGEGEGEGEGGEGEGEGEGGEGEGEGEGEGKAPALQTVLLVGNSQLGLNPPDVAEALEAMSLVAFGGAHTLVVDRFQEFGQGCARFATDGGLAMAESGNYDVVILMPAIGETRANEACWEQFRVAAEGAGARFGVMATAHVRNSFPAGFTTLHNAIGAYAADHDLLFVPAGDAWLRFLSENPAAPLKSLYASDSQHPGAEGDLLYVYTLYGALARVSTVGLPPDVLQLRCNMNQPCLSYDALDACVGDNGDFNCSGQNGALFGPNDGGARVAFVTADEALTYQQAADAALAAR